MFEAIHFYTRLLNLLPNILIKVEIDKIFLLGFVLTWILKKKGYKFMYICGLIYLQGYITERKICSS